MPFVNAICPECEKEIQLDDQAETGFCLGCGTRVNVGRAVEEYQDSHPQEPEPPALPPEADEIRRLYGQAQMHLTDGDFDGAENAYRSVLIRKPGDPDALWGLILAGTNNLSPMPLSAPDDFCYSQIGDLLELNPPKAELWREQYFSAFEKCCEETVGSIDTRVFLELEVFKWCPEGNAYLHPVSRGFDLEPVFQEVLWKTWNPLIECLPDPEAQARVTALGDDCCQEIWDYFDTGFANLEALRSGKLEKLMGLWQMRLTTGNIKADVLKFSRNALGVHYLETCRLKFNHYDYYRYVKIDQAHRVLAAEHRHFPSSIGMGGDFASHPEYEPVIGIMAIYDYILVLPTALYVRAEPDFIPGYDRALVYQQKCRTAPCFQRNSLKSAVQIRPIAENHDTAEPSKRVSACYIATAVYGDEDAPQVLRLRQFRDETLHRSVPGRWLSHLYYRFSPPLAQKLKNARFVNRLVRRVLDRVVKILGQ